MSGLFFGSAFAAFGNINMQPTPAPASLSFGSLILNAASSAPKLNVFNFANILSIHQEKNVIPILRFNQITPTISPRTISSVHWPLNLPILPCFNRDPLQANRSDDRLAGKQNLPNPRFTPYEALTGISKIRPEILLATNFQPVFDPDHKHSQRFNERKTDQLIEGLNPYGEFIDSQIQINHLQHEAIGKLIFELKRDDPKFADEMTGKENQFHFHMNNLRAHSNYLRNVVSQLNNLKHTYDLRTEEFYVDFSRISYDYFQDARQQLLSNIEQKFEENVGFRSILVDLGFVRENIQSFSSTKIYFQTLYELSNLLKGYSNNLLGINNIEQRDDANATYVNKHKIKDFHFDITNITAPTFKFLQNLRQPDVLSVVNEINEKFDSLFSNLHLANDESKIALLLSYLTKEYGFSTALGSQQVRDYIQQNFGYAISTDFSNAALFDVMIGNIGEKITDTVNNFSENSLATLGQQINGTLAVLPFETAYVTFENSTYTPGSVYLIDKMLDVGSDSQVYNTTNLESYVNRVETQIGRLSTMARYLNLTPQIYFFDRTLFHGIMKESNVLFDNIISDYLDMKDFTLKQNMDSDVVAVFNKAQNDNRLKSLLFLYVFTRTFGLSNVTSTQTLDVLIKEISRSVGLSLGHDRRSVTHIFARRFGLHDRVNHNASPAESMEHILKTSNDFLSVFFNQFIRIFNAFNSAAFVSKGNGESYTIYSHTQNTTLMLVIFELLLSIVNKYVKKTFIGRFLTRSHASIGKEFYSTRTSFTSNTISIQIIHSKLAFENDIKLKILYVLLSSMQRIKDSSKNTINELRSPNSVKNLNEILQILGDRDTLHMIMNDQQIHLIESTVEDITDKLTAPAYTTGTAGSENSTSSEEDVQLSLGNNKDDITILDDSLISDKLRNAMFSYLAQDKFTSSEAANTRLLTIGIPLGFSNDLRQNIKVSKVNAKSFEPKQTDIIRINVFKVDVEHQDIIFKPRRYLFEMNRYVVKNDRSYRDMPFLSSIEDILDAIPTRDFSMVEGSLKNRFSYFRDADMPLLYSPEYDFLSDSQKSQLLENHVSSYLYEIYIRLLTGMRLSEHDFLTHPENVSHENTAPFLIERLVDHRISKHFTFTTNALKLVDLSAFGVARQVPILRDRFDYFLRLPEIPIHVQYRVAHAMYLIHHFRRCRTQYSDDVNESKRIFTPKTFERIFTVAVNPNDFEIDVEETLKTTSGRDMFNKLLRQGRIVKLDNQYTGHSSIDLTQDVYKLVGRDKNVGDLVFEKYFVNLETALNTEV